MIYTARTIVEQGKVPTVSKTHFPFKKVQLPKEEREREKERERGRGGENRSVSSDSSDTGSKISLLWYDPWPGEHFIYCG